MNDTRPPEQSRRTRAPITIIMLALHAGAVAALWHFTWPALFVGLALYDQTRVVKPTNSSAEPYQYQGAEVELNYQPNRNFYATFSYGLIDAEAAYAGFEVLNTNISTLYPEVQSANFAPDLRVQGLPKHQFNALAAYTFDNGFGASLAATLQTTRPEVRVVALGVPDKLIDQAPRARQLEWFGLTPDGIARRILALHREESLQSR